MTAVDVDMSDLTDTFMTIATIAVCAQGTTRITNIANQRVKECNRIEAMGMSLTSNKDPKIYSIITHSVKELSKLGVNASELETGIQIEGVGADLSRLHGIVFSGPP